jgi:hypothetical protein
MKIVLSQKEVRGLAKFIDEIDKVQGLDSKVMDKIYRDITIDKKACITSILTGELTFEVKEKCTVEFLGLVNGIIIESAPVFKAMYNLGAVLSPISKSYADKFKSFFNKWQEPINKEENNAQASQ